MPDRLNLTSVVGARPQFVKLAPVVRAMAGHKRVRHTVIHTGQHYDQNMSASFFEQLELPEPDMDLNAGSGSHGAQTAAMLTRLEEAFSEDRPEAVLVYGDTNSTLAATLAAAKLHVPVAHVEAGLRSFNRQMPEEINRLVADHCSDRLYAPTPQALSNLERENLGTRAVLTGDVMLDAVLHNKELAAANSKVLEELGLKAGRFGLVTVHRPVNTTGPALGVLMQALEQTAARYLRLIFPVHPRTRVVLDESGYVPPNGLTLVSPLPYLDNIALIEAAAMVITDSGGVQKEAAFLNTPCLTMRDETEWTETLKIGINRLVGDGGAELVAAVSELLEAGNMFNDVTKALIENHYGSGTAAVRMVDDCVSWLS